MSDPSVRGAQEALKIVEEALELINDELDQNEKGRQRLLADRERFRRHRAVLRRETVNPGEECG